MAVIQGNDTEEDTQCVARRCEVVNILCFGGSDGTENEDRPMLVLIINCHVGLQADLQPTLDGTKQERGRMPKLKVGAEGARSGMKVGLQTVNN